ncbi:MAG: pyridoxal phosphate-dependent aminotransferase [Planctomycetes bacterium]|nr:pyridoxal phosphate-dependent aminotransferase [Planctomycetota bacterium]
MPRTLASRLSRLGTESAFDVLARAKDLEKQGRSIVHLEIGEPDFDTPGNIIAAAKTALDDGFTHYMPSAGYDKLRESIAKYISRTRNINTEAENVVVTPGAKPIMFYSIFALAEAGDEVIYPNPGFPIYESVINFAGAKAVPIKIRKDRNFKFDIDDFRNAVSDKTKLVIINSPHNPTGGLLTEKELEVVAECAQEYDFWVLSDEVYEYIIYNGKFNSIVNLPNMLDRTILLNGYSKTYAMTGWRLGYGVMPKEFAKNIAKMITNIESCTSAFTQVAGIEALDGDQTSVLNMVKELETRRDVMVEGINSIEGLHAEKPDGAFYLFIDVSKFAENSKEIADFLLESEGVAVLDGKCFGSFGDGFIRLSYAASMENIVEGLKRIKKGIAKLR